MRRSWNKWTISGSVALLALGGRWAVHGVIEATVGSMSTSSKLFLEMLGLTAIFALGTWRLLATVSTRRAAVPVEATVTSRQRTVAPITFDEPVRRRHLSLVPAPSTD